MKSQIRRRNIASIIDYNWLNSGGGSPIPVVYPSTDYAILSGAPNTGSALDYLAFVDSDIASDGTRYLIYFEGPSHSAGYADSSIIFRKRPLGGSLGSPVVIATGSSNVTVIDPALGVTQTGRILAFYVYRDETISPASRTTYLKYSDDGGDTWSSEILFSSEQGVGQPYYQKQLNGPGRAIQYDGYMLKPMFGTTTPGVGGRLGRLYKSVNDGITWTFVANIWPASNDDGEEPTLVALSSGRLIATQRSDTVYETRLLYSDDGGLTWSSPISIGFPSVGKSPIAVSPSGTLLIMGRWYSNNGRPMYSYSNSADGISGWSAPQQVSVRTSAWLYGGIVWDHIEDMFIADWAQGVPNEDAPGISGPTIIFEKQFIPSTIPIEPPPAYNYFYQNVIDYPQGRGVTVPAYGALTDLQNALVQGMVDDGTWSEHDMLHVFENNDNTLSAWSLYNWVKPSRYLATAINTPTYGVNGWAFNGTDEIINLNWRGSDGNNFTLDDASLWVWVHADAGGSTGRAIAASNSNASTQTRGPSINPRSTTDLVVSQINDDTNDTSANTDGTGFFLNQRRSSTDKRIRRNDAEIGSYTVTSIGRGVTDIAVGGIMFANGPGLYRNCTVSFCGAGSSMVGLENSVYNRLLTYKTAVEAL